jgi:predicted nucleic acid-binding protein
MDAFDANMLIYAAQDDPRGAAVEALLHEADLRTTCIGSTMLLPEVLSLPIRRDLEPERRRLQELLARLELKSVDYETADLAAELGAKYKLRAADAVHLATAVMWGADRFHTNNSKDFGQHIDEIEIVLPQF